LKEEGEPGMSLLDITHILAGLGSRTALVGIMCSVATA
jgi:hypothetical protein